MKKFNYSKICLVLLILVISSSRAQNLAEYDFKLWQLITSGKDYNEIVMMYKNTNIKFNSDGTVFIPDGKRNKAKIWDIHSGSLKQALSFNYLYLKNEKISKSIQRKTTDLPTPRSEVAAIPYNGKIYVIGGFDNSGDSKKVEVYDPATNSWEFKADYPPGGQVNGVVYQNKIYTFLFFQASWNGYSSQTWVYDPLTDTWEQKDAQYQFRWARQNVFEYNGNIYLVGGNRYCSTTADNIIDKFNIASNSWETAITTIPCSISTSTSHATAIVGNKIYVIGGATDLSWCGPYDVYSEVLEYDIDNGLWSSKTQYPINIMNATAVTHNNKIYVIGGTNGAYEDKRNEIYVFDPTTNVWSLFGNLSSGGYPANTCVLDDKLYVIFSDGHIEIFNLGGSTPSIANTNNATLITSSGAVLNGTVNANSTSTTVTFEYGTTTNYGTTVNATPNIVTGSSPTSVSANISGLSPNTTYHFRVRTQNSTGTSLGDDMTLTTAATTAPPTLLGATTHSIGDSVILTFDKPMADPTGKQGQFTVMVNSNPDIITEATLDSDPTKIRLKLTNNVLNGQTVEVSYTAGDVFSADGGVLAIFTSQNVVNNSIMYRISGVVTENSIPLSGVYLRVAQYPPYSLSSPIITDASGSYSFLIIGLLNITLEFGKDGYKFADALTPAQNIVFGEKNYTMINSNLILNLVATNVLTSYTVRGRVKDAQTNLPLSNVTVSIYPQRNSSVSGSTTTDINGDYQFGPFLEGVSLSVNVTPPAGYRGTNGWGIRCLDNPQANIQEYIFAEVPTTLPSDYYPLYGRARTGIYAGPIIQGVTIDLTGASTNSTITDNKGIYTFVVQNNSSYTLVPSLTGISFTQPSRSFVGSQIQVFDFISTYPDSNPTVTKITRNTIGDSIILTFDKAMANPSGLHSLFIINVDGNANPTTAATLDVNPCKIRLKLTNNLSLGQTATVSYSSGPIISADGMNLLSFGPTNVQSDQPPILLNASTNTVGDSIVLTFDKPMADPIGTHTQFTILANGISNNSSEATLDSDANKIRLHVPGHLFDFQTISISYTSGTVSSADGGMLANFGPINVTNISGPMVAPGAVSLSYFKLVRIDDGIVTFNPSWNSISTNAIDDSITYTLHLMRKQTDGTFVDVRTYLMGRLLTKVLDATSLTIDLELGSSTGYNRDIKLYVVAINKWGLSTTSEVSNIITVELNVSPSQVILDLPADQDKKIINIFRTDNFYSLRWSPAIDLNGSYDRYAGSFVSEFPEFNKYVTYYGTTYPNDYSVIDTMFYAVNITRTTLYPAFSTSAFPSVKDTILGPSTALGAPVVDTALILTDATLKQMLGDADSATYSWRVTAIDRGKPYNWANGIPSATKNFTLAKFMLTSPTQNSPLNNSTNVSIESPLIFDTTSHSKIRLQLSDDQYFTNRIKDTIILYPYNFLKINYLNSQKKYYWRVCLTSGSSNTSTWSSTWNFTTGNVPNPNFQYPLESASLYASRDSLFWSSPLSNSYYSWLQISTDMNFSNLTYNTLQVFPFQSSGNYSFLPLNFLQPGTYYWRVRTNTSGNQLTENSDWTATRSFMILNPSYIISGNVSGTDSAIISVSGDTTFSVLTDANGNYSFTLSSLKNYVITPYKQNYDFSPIEKVINNLSSNISQDFVASLKTFKISGTVLYSNTPLQNVKIKITGSKTDSILTDANGQYSFTVNTLGNYKVTPSLSGYTFTPIDLTFTSTTSDQVCNFTASMNKYTISGIVKKDNIPAQLVKVIITGTKIDSVLTDISGRYQFTLNAIGNYTISPALSGYTFTPENIQLQNLTSDKTQDFNGTATVYTISGTVTGASLVNMILSGDTTMSAVVDQNGNFTFKVKALGNYILAPQKSGYTFDPTNKSFTNLMSNQTQNFIASSKLVKISGKILSGNVTLSNVTVTISGDSVKTVVTDLEGNYSFTGIATKTYNITPSKSGYSFSPTNQTITNLLNDTVQNFTATINRLTIRGSIKSGGIPLSGVNVNISGSSNENKLTDEFGNYSFTVNALGNYTITPSKDGYNFIPENKTITNLLENQQVDFSGTIKRFTVSGTVLQKDKGLAYVKINVNSDSSFVMLSDSNGYYSFSGVYGKSYTIIPSKEGYTFTPQTDSILNLKENRTKNFSATLNTYSLNGTIKLNNSALSGVIVNLSGSLTETDTTDSDGNYSFNVPATGNYTILPIKTGYTFLPSKGEAQNVLTDQKIDFSAEIIKYKISGRVTLNGSGYKDVKLNISGTDGFRFFTTSDSNGVYSFTVNMGTTYTIIPEKTGYDFTPKTQIFTNLSEDKTEDFTATPKTQIKLSETKLEFTTVQNSNIPQELKFTISNPGGGSLYCSITNSTSWLVADPRINVLQGTDVKVKVNTTKFAPGIYHDTLYVSDTNAINSPQVLVVNYTIIQGLPLAPELVAPLNSRENLIAPIKFEWNYDQNSELYAFQLSEDSTFVEVSLIDSSLTTTSKMVDSLKMGTKYYWRVRGKNYGGYGDWSIIWNFTSYMITLSKVQLISPTNNERNVNSSPLLAWNPDNEAKSYRLQVAKDTNFSSTSIVVERNEITTTDYQITQLEYAKEYYWRVSSSYNDLSGAWSDIYKFRTYEIVLKTPEFTLVKDSLINQLPSLYHAWNKDSLANNYHIQVSKDSIFTQMIMEDSLQENTFRSVGPLEFGAKYYSRLRSKSSIGSSLWTGNTSITTKAAPPVTPVQQKPADLSGEQLLPVSFEWSIIPNASTYHLQASIDGTFGTTVINDSTIKVNTYSTDKLLNSTRYYWRVLSMNATGKSEWSTKYMFTTVAARVKLISPLTNLLNTPVTLTFNWERNSAIIFLPSIKDIYTLEIAEDSFFTKNKMSEIATAVGSKTTGPLKHDLQYYWRVIDNTVGVKMPASEVWKFKTESSPLITPVCISPINQSINQPINLSLTWGNVPNAILYRLQLSKDSLFVTNQIDERISGTARGVTSLLNGQKYFWRVRAEMGTIIGDWSSTNSFNTMNAIPSAPIILYPSSTSTLFNMFVELFKWNKSQCAIYYDVQIATDQGFSNLVYEGSGVDTSRYINQLSYSTIYYLRVKARNNEGSSNYSAVQTFKTIDPPPVKVTLVEPVNNATNVPAQTETIFNWNTLSNALNYYPVISLSERFDPNKTIINPTLSNNSFVVSDLEFNTQYFWRCKAQGDNGMGEWSDIWTFKTNMGNSPTPVLNLPSNGATQINPNVLLSWSVKGNVKYYSVEVAKTVGFENPVISVKDYLKDTLRLTLLDNGTTYYWRVRTYNDFSTGDWVFSSFTTLVTSERPAWNTVTNPETQTMYFDKYFTDLNTTVTTNNQYGQNSNGLYCYSSSLGKWELVGTDSWKMGNVNSICTFGTFGTYIYASAERIIWKLKKGTLNWIDDYHAISNIILRIYKPNPYKSYISGSYGQSQVYYDDALLIWKLMPKPPLIIDSCQNFGQTITRYDGCIFVSVDKSTCSTGVCEVFYSTNNGINWVSTNFNGMNGASTISLMTLNNSNELIVTAKAGSRIIGTFKYSKGFWKEIKSNNQSITCFVELTSGQLYAAVSSPTQTGIMYKKVGSGNSISSILDGVEKSGVVTSTDGGETWHEVNGGLIDTKIASLSLSDDGKILAVTTSGAVYESEYNAINEAPYFVKNIKDTIIYKDQTLNLIITASDKNNDKISFTVNNLPKTAKFDSLSGFSRAIRWTPTKTDVGNYPNISVTISDGKLSESFSFSITVSDLNSVPKITTLIRDTTISENQTLSFKVSATDGDNDVLSFSGANLPKNARLDFVDAYSRNFSWKPLSGENGTYKDLKIIVSDGILNSEAKFSITVLKVNNAPGKFNLLSPLASEDIQLTYPAKPIRFKWSNSSDPDQADKVSYRFALLGTTIDTTIYGLNIPDLSLNIMNKLKPSSEYRWHVISTDGFLFTYSDTIKFKTKATVLGAGVQNQIPSTYSLEQNYPNPFNPSTTIRISLPKADIVTLEIYNILGQRVCSLIDKQMYDAGIYSIQWNGKDKYNKQVSTGVYFYHLRTKEYVKTMKMLMLR